MMMVVDEHKQYFDLLIRELPFSARHLMSRHIDTGWGKVLDGAVKAAHDVGNRRIGLDASDDGVKAAGRRHQTCHRACNVVVLKGKECGSEAAADRGNATPDCLRRVPRLVDLWT